MTKMLISLLFSFNVLFSQSFWQPSSGPTNGNYTSIAFDSSNYIFVSTVDNGILRSSDSGKTWQSFSIGIPTYIRKVVVDNRGTVYIGTTMGTKGIYKSTDKGLTWFGLLFDEPVNSLFVDENNYIYAGTWSGVFRSTNEGNSWLKILSSHTMINFMYKRGPLLITAFSSNLMISTNSGITWTTRGIDGIGNYFSGIINSNNHIIISGGGKIFKSANNGLRWDKGTSNFGNAYDVCINSFNNLFIATYNGIFYSKDEGITWAPLNDGLTTLNAQIIGIDLSGHLYCGTYRDRLYKSTKSTNQILIDLTPRKIFISSQPSTIIDSILVLNESLDTLIISNVIVSNPEITVSPTEAIVCKGDSIYFKVIFLSTLRGIYGGSIFFINNGYSNNDELKINIFKELPFCELNRNIISFGIIPIIGIPEIDSFYIKNLGFDTLKIYSFDIDDPAFSISEYLPNILYSQSQRIYVRFKPSLVKYYLNDLIIISNSPTSPDTIKLSAYGVINVEASFATKKNISSNLDQNYPNPFNSTSKIKYQIANMGHVTLKVYDVLGRELETLVNEEKLPGEYEVQFTIRQLTDDSRLTSGVYFYQLKAGTYLKIKKMIVLK